MNRKRTEPTPRLSSGSQVGARVFDALCLLGLQLLDAYYYLTAPHAPDEGD